MVSNHAQCVSFHCVQPEQLSELLGLAVLTFRAAFEHRNTPEDFECYMADAFTVSQLQSEMEDPDTAFWFIHVDDEVAGYAKLCRNARSYPFVPGERPTLLQRIYIHPEMQGKGLGAKFLAFCEEEAQVWGKADILWLGVWDENHGAYEFYTRHGYQRVGEHPFLLGSDLQTDWIMAKVLGAVGAQ